jgi:hypothetical protein
VKIQLLISMASPVTLASAALWIVAALLWWRGSGDVEDRSSPVG